eukprot:610516_1
MLASCLTISYDVLGQVISVLDVTTDIIVCIGFYQKDRMVFFGISLTILCLALIAYDMAFVLRFSREKNGGDLALFACLLPVSPFLPFVFYFTDSNDKPLSKFLEKHCCGFNIKMDPPWAPEDASKLRKFMESKVEKHLGFILEALVEAFPQAILQMIAIVVYNEANVIAIISILVSMLSMASKSFIFSVASAITIKQLMWNWLCAVTDFFAIFVTVSWVFFTPQSDHLSDFFVMIRTIWLYKLYIGVFPLIGVVSIGCHVAAMIESIYELKKHVDGKCAIICGSICLFFLVTFGWICGIIASVLVLEILCWTWPAFIFFALGTDRFDTSKSSLEFWFTLIGWINNAKTHRIESGCVSFTKQQDKMMRLCSVNQILLARRPFPADKTLKAYLTRNKKENQYMEVTMSEFRSNTKNIKHSQFILNFWHQLYGEIWNDISDSYNHAIARNQREEVREYGFFAVGAGLATFILGPLYGISRFITLLFPWFIVICLYVQYAVNIWNTEFVDRFQVVMITVYLILCVILSILFYLNCCEQYLMAHILPAESWFWSNRYYDNVFDRKDEYVKAITNHYFGIIVIPMRRAIVTGRFGPDLGKIILSYLPIDDEYENANQDVVAPKMII